MTPQTLLRLIALLEELPQFADDAERINETEKQVGTFERKGLPITARLICTMKHRQRRGRRANDDRSPTRRVGVVNVIVRDHAESDCYQGPSPNQAGV
jgi:hypothetical protein